MTAQFQEKLLYEGKEMSMCEEPLAQFFSLTNHWPKFQEVCTALWRGYIGSWEIINDRLYLTGIDATLENGEKVTLETLFPGYPERVFAHWYSGTLRIPQGELLEYVHMGYGSKYERDLLIDIEKGVITRTRVTENDISDE